VGSLFSGIGGIDLGLERAGMEIKWQAEINPSCLNILKKHWPSVQRFSDVRTIDNLPKVDVICGGFPCQDISTLNVNGKGLNGCKSGLWYEMLRIIRTNRPKYILIENVSNLLVRGIDTILGNLASIRYNAEWETIQASSIGAPHQRRRTFIVAYPEAVPGPQENPCFVPIGNLEGESQTFVHMDWAQMAQHDWEMVESYTTGDADGIPGRVDRIKGLGNAVVPQIAEYIGRCIIEHDQRIIS